MILPSYNIHSNSLRQTDLDTIMLCQDPGELCRRIYRYNIDDFMDLNSIGHYLKSPDFHSGADYFESDKLIKILSNVIFKVHQAAATFGFPGPPTIKQGSRIDVALTRVLWEALEESGVTVTFSDISSKFFQQFMTQRIIPLVTFWRWKVVTGNTLSIDRVACSPRNYFYVLWVSGYLFDSGTDAPDTRWALLENMSADSLVQIIERSGIGYRKGFAQAIAAERKRRSVSVSGGVLDKLVRGCMKRASFTFATSVMPDDEGYYKKIAEYLFRWSELNYLPVKENTTEYN